MTANTLQTISQILSKSKLTIVFILITMLTITVSIPDNPDVGYRVGKVQSYKKLREFKNSALYEIKCDKLDDGRPIKLLDLHGSHYEAGYAYAKLMAKQIHFTYQTFFHAALDTELEIKIIQLFLDWQYQSYVRKYLPIQFLEELRGLSKGGRQQGFKQLGVYFERVLVISSFPGALQHDIVSVLADQFLKAMKVKNQKVESFIQDSFIKIQKIIGKFLKKIGIQCSFFAIWGKRTTDSKLYSMRNLDWLENTGVNENKLITVWNLDGAIPHLTLGFPGVLGALTGMSKAGLTVHEAGLSSHHSTQLGFQWTLRMRYVMMKAVNLEQAKKIWQSTKNTLGMNFMIASANDNVPSGKPAMAMQTMRGYTAFFHDYDPRQNGTKFVDPNTKKQYIAGYSMPDAVFRTNHAYDPIILKHLRNPHIPFGDDSMIRYRVLKDGFNWYRDNNQLMSQTEALNMTAILGDKGSEKFLSCKNNNRGLNVISVTYEPKQLMMWAGFQYGYQKTFKSACCGVYVQVDMKKWWNNQVEII